MEWWVIGIIGIPVGMLTFCVVKLILESIFQHSIFPAALIHKK